MKNASLRHKTFAQHSVLAAALGLAMPVCAQPQSPSADAPTVKPAATAAATAIAAPADERTAFTWGAAGTHGAGPFWMALDGGKVNGSVQSQAATSSTAAIPWLLLATQSTGGTGRRATVTHVQRINTVGGTAPAMGCASAADAGQQGKAGYTADYVFYVKR